MVEETETKIVPIYVQIATPGNNPIRLFVDMIILKEYLQLNMQLINIKKTYLYVGEARFAGQMFFFLAIGIRIFSSSNEPVF